MSSMTKDNVNLVYNINLCRICQIPDQLDLVQTDTTTENGETYLEQLKFIFQDIFWTEDKQISLACKTCLEKVTDIAEFKRLCLKTNGRRGALIFDQIKAELDAIKLEEDQAVTEQQADEPEAETAPQQRAKRKLSVSKDDQPVNELKSRKSNRKTKGKPLEKTRINRESKRRPKKVAKPKKIYEIHDFDEISESEDILQENIFTDVDSKENKKLPTYARQYQPTKNEKNCRVCKKEFSNFNNLKKHVTTNHLKMIYPCDICQELCPTQDKFDRHMFKHTDVRNYICTVCGKKFITNGDLCNHKRRHVEELKYLCDICPDKRFRVLDSLRKHKAIVHTDPKEYKYTCTECGFKFALSNGLRIHMLRHKDVRNFPCHICDKSFHTLHSLRLHAAAHTNVKAFKCDLCPAEYKLKQILLKHKTKCHGIGNYKLHIVEKVDCTICGKNIASKDKLQRHIRTHTGLKPYSCRLCNQKFICKSYIKGHVRSKHDVDVDAPDYKTSLYFDVCDEEVSKDEMSRSAINASRVNAKIKLT